MTQYEPIFWDIEATGLQPVEQWDKEGLDPQVISVAHATIGEWRHNELAETVDIDVEVTIGKSEYAMLKRARGKLRDEVDRISDTNTVPFLVGYNSRIYDHTYICGRMGRLRLDPEPFASKLKRLDLMRALNYRMGYYGSQDDYAKELDIFSDEDTITGGDIPEAFRKDRLDKIKKHSYWDTYDLAHIFLHHRQKFMDHFYDHYDLDGEFVMVEEGL